MRSVLRLVWFGLGGGALVALGPVLPVSAQEAEAASAPSDAAPSGADVAPTDERSARAHAAFLRGRDAYTAGRFEEALALFEEAYAIEPHPVLLYNIANAHDRLGQLEEALRRYREYRAALPEAENIEFVSRRIQLIEEEMGRREEASTPTQSPEPSDSSETSDSAEPAPDSSGREANLTPTVTVLSVAGAVGLAAIGTGVASFVVRNDIASDCVDSVCPASRRADADTMHSLAIATDVLMGVSLIGIAVGIVLRLTADGGEEPSVACGPRGCAAVVGF